MLRKIILGCTLALALLAGQKVDAAVVSSLPNGINVPMPAINYFGTGPQAMAPGITWTAEYINSVFGYTGGYGFAANGFWNGLTMMGTNNSFLSMAVTFDSPVSGVGGFVNYAPGTGLPQLSAYNGEILLESVVLTFLTGGGLNSGQFVGFLFSSPSITKFVLQGAYVGLANLRYELSPVPLPGALIFLISGLGGMSAFNWFRRRKLAA